MSHTPPLAQAMDLIRAGRVNRAVALLERNHADPACAVRLREIFLGEHDDQRALPYARQLAPGHDAESHVSRSILALISGDLDSAVRECEAALAMQPDLATAHNHLGRALHNAGHSVQAASALRKAVALDTHYAEAWYNLGLVLRFSGAMGEAIEAFRQALQLAPAYRSAELNLGITLLLVERVDEALFCFEELLDRNPADVDALVNAGLSHHTLGQFNEARRCYDQAIELAPHNAQAWCYLGLLRHECQQPEAALEALETALELDAMDVEAWAEIASIHEQANRLREAGEAIARGRQVDPNHPALRLEAARIQRRGGDAEGAVRVLSGLAGGQLPARLAQQVQFELGTALDRAGRFDEAVAAFNAGNRLLAASVRRRDVDPGGFERRCRALEAWLDEGAPGAAPEAGDPGDDLGADLVFLVGFPRSGTTLLDTMLDAHPDVDSIEELPTLEAVIEWLHAQSGGYPRSMAGLDGNAVRELRERYRAECRRFLVGRTPPRTLDKLPLRSLHVGLIHRLFPAARIIFALRHPCDVVVSNFMQAYAVNEAFIHFDTLASSAAMYDRVMRLWQKLERALPLAVHYLKYEDLVAEPRAEIDRLCAFLELEAAEAMLDTEQRMAGRGPIMTSSYQQVAEPIYQRASGRWINYRKHLEPSLLALEPHARRLGYSLAAARDEAAG